MRLKLDENLGHRCVAQLETGGHDVATVAGEGMAGAVDSLVIEHCRAEGRVLVTLDLDFANPLRFDPQRYAGIAVLRLPNRPSPQDLFDAVETLIAALSAQPITNQFWIVERGRIREYQRPDPLSD
jgi:predicted nuclease of predicted toxin-antitoxin system